MVASNEIERRLREWGATRIQTQHTNGHASIDFHTPLPGDQPIRSGIQVDGGAVTEATIRYGVLDATHFPNHPTKDNGALLRLRGAVPGSEMPDGLVVVNYGDTHRDPRPHVLYGWTPEGGSIEVSDLEYLQRGDAGTRADPAQFVDWMIRAGRRIRREYRGEWVQETDDDGGEMPDLRDLAPDSVTEDWD